ncbi:hypothetical protein MMC16_005804 [Acarospora aff. strigata]|nr:hypothetical protein [Acarospora aff. strigata]
MDETAIPYSQGAKFTIYRHVPPEPTPLDSRYCKRRDVEELRMTFIERCLIHPPLPGTTLWAESSSITITDDIIPGSGPGARLLGVNGVNGNVVAKIYDPLYYQTPTPSDSYHVDPTPFLNADHQYAHEAAAYAKVSSRLGGTIIPEYHGSYTCELPVVSVSGATTRSVRLILIERIPGTCMRDLQPRRMRIPQHQRANVMAKIVDAESLLFSCKVGHGDLNPRNIIVCGGDLGDTDLRVVLIDLGSSRVYVDDSFIDPSGLPLSPLLRWDARGYSHQNFEALGWIDWDWQTWLEQRWSGSNAYAPITKKSREDWLGRYDNPPPPIPLSAMYTSGGSLGSMSSAARAMLMPPPP